MVKDLHRNCKRYQHKRTITRIHHFEWNKEKNVQKQPKLDAVDGQSFGIVISFSYIKIIFFRFDFIVFFVASCVLVWLLQRRMCMQSMPFTSFDGVVVVHQVQQCDKQTNRPDEKTRELPKINRRAKRVHRSTIFRFVSRLLLLLSFSFW